MSEIKVRTNTMQQIASQEEQLARQLKGYMAEISAVRNSLGFKVKSRAQIDAQLKTLATITEKNVNRLHNLSSTLSNAASTYTNTEKKVVDHAGTVLVQAVKPAASTGAISPSSIFKRLDLYDVLLFGFGGISGLPLVLAHQSGAFANWKGDWSFLSGSTGTGGKFFGQKWNVGAEGSVFGVKTSSGAKSKWDISKGDFGLDVFGKVDTHLAQGKVKGSFGKLSADATGTVGAGSVEGSIGAGLFKNGKFSPQLTAKAKAEAKAISGEANVKYGNDQFNRHGKASGSLGSASAEASAGVGKITYTDSAGNEKTGYGAQAKVGAEAYLAEGKISGGFTVFGIKVDVGVSGKAGGVGAKAEARAATGGVSGEIGLGLGVGAGAEVSIDWSGFKWTNPFSSFAGGGSSW